jgi:hypothetical protein
MTETEPKRKSPSAFEEGKSLVAANRALYTDRWLWLLNMSPLVAELQDVFLELFPRAEFEGVPGLPRVTDGLAGIRVGLCEALEWADEKYYGTP